MQIKEIDYFSATEIQQEIGVVRQTLWRWRKAKKIPQGRLYRGRQVVFTKQEVEAIREYANRLEPAGRVTPNQLKFFANSPKRKVT